MKPLPVAALAMSALALISLPVSAADMAVKMPVKAPPPPLVLPPTVTWTGCYVSAGVGYGMWVQPRYTVQDDPSTLELKNGGEGWLGRLGGGCDYQMTGAFSNWVVGLFGDYDFMNLKGTGEFLPFTNNPPSFATNRAGDEKERSARGLFWRNEYRYASYGPTDLPVVNSVDVPLAGEHLEKHVQTVTSSLVWRW